MNLSDEQMACITGQGVSQFEPFDLPTGRQDLPEWIRGARVDWMFGCSNPPHVSLKVLGNVRNWPGQTWVKEGSKCYIARHPDGRAEVLYHAGAISAGKAWRVVDPAVPGTTDPAIRSAWTRWRLSDNNEKESALKQLVWLQERNLFSGQAEIETRDVLTTTQQDGFGGSHYHLDMADGTLLILRGPWHGGPPAGYVEVNPIDITAPYYRTNPRRPRPWHRNGGTVGYVTEELLLKILAAYCPHVGVARVLHSYGPRVECFDQRWGTSKASMYALEHGRAQRGEPAGPFWRVYWDGSERYCGGLRIPKYGFQPGVTDVVTA